ncbi:hypothetical protein PMKS-002924 [Pichia membranifaciens]|uniref:Mitochondrial import inner membrane translocase subunit TIM22 n=1 Tax=Pichia membranifaciens TaxID=4926 RepID=A0A1Q2YIQ8_9ASCO|nr:hypothetical protein PMKS-002924 [Pichia membranifaciens]
MSEMTPEEQGEEGARQIMAFVSSCPGKAMLAGGSGFVLGGVFGFFMASMSYDTPLGIGQAGGGAERQLPSAEGRWRDQREGPSSLRRGDAAGRDDAEQYDAQRHDVPAPRQQGGPQRSHSSPPSP